MGHPTDFASTRVYGCDLDGSNDPERSYGVKTYPRVLRGSFLLGVIFSGTVCCTMAIATRDW